MFLFFVKKNTSSSLDFFGLNSEDGFNCFTLFVDDTLDKNYNSMKKWSKTAPSFFIERNEILPCFCLTYLYTKREEED